MICSMTGFGKAEVQDTDMKISVEIRSVNHRYLECGIRIPRILHAYESYFRSVVKEYAARGKVDVFISVEDERDTGSVLHVNTVLAEQYAACAEKLEKELGVVNDLTVSRILSLPEILRMETAETDEEALKGAVENVLRMACGHFRDAREKEGERLREDLLNKLAELEKNVDLVILHEPEIMKAYTEKLREKTAELLEDAQIDESRIASEVVLFADKICTDEETVRLKSHIGQMREALQKGEGIGRKLDFLAQEMNREANTILSKAGDMATSDLGVTLKTDIEKIREQVQNIE